MHNGMYEFIMQSEASQSAGSLVLQNGTIFGIDAGGACYDGTYVLKQDGNTDLQIKVTIPADVPSVIGLQAKETWSIDLNCNANLDADAGEIHMETPVGKKVAAAYRFLRPIPTT